VILAENGKGGDMPKIYFIPTYGTYPIVDTSPSSLVQGMIDRLIEQEARDLIVAFEKEAVRFEEAGNDEMAAKLREWKAEFEAIWNDEPTEPNTEEV
jgi:hypothetical protein